MNVTLYNNQSAANKIGKTLTNSYVISNAILRAECDILRPRFEISMNSDTFTAVNYNYCYIPLFNRYYFINDISQIRKDCMVIACQVDVLESFSSEILENTAVIERNEKLYNLYLNDPMFKCYQNSQITLRTFKKNGNDFEFDIDDFSYIFTIAGDRSV